MRRLLVLLIPLALAGPISAFAKGEKGDFALTMQGGGFGNLENRFFKSLSFVVSGGLEYYPLSPVSAGLQFQFSPKGTVGTPVTLGVGSISGSGSRRSDRLFQTTLFVRPTLATGSAVKFFGLAGATLTKITFFTNGGETVATGPPEPENEGNKIGVKFGAGTLLHLRSNTHLNITAAYDTRPQKLFSAQAGLTFFFNPFLQKTDPPEN
jgi:opacity protein-like surface antigen